MRPAQYTYVAQDLAAICGYQTTAGAGNLTINGTYVDGQALGVGVQRAILPGGFARAIAINSSSDVSAINFTVYGINSYGQTVSQTISGPNASIVYTSRRFRQVNRVAADAAVASNTRVGIAGNGVSSPFLIDIFQNPINIGVGVTVSGTATYSVQETDTELDPYIAAGGDVDAIFWKNIQGISGLTASTIDNVNTAHGYVRLTVSGAGATAVVQGTFSQAGGGTY